MDTNGHGSESRLQPVESHNCRRGWMYRIARAIEGERLEHYESDANVRRPVRQGFTAKDDLRSAAHS